MSNIQGLERLLARLNNISDANVHDALQKACLMVEADAKVNCPVDDGQLR